MVMVGMFILRAADVKKPRLLVRDGVFVLHDPPCVVGISLSEIKR